MANHFTRSHSLMASQITSLTIVYSTVYSGADQRKHQSSASLAFVWGIHRGPGNSPHKWPVAREMFPFDDVMMSTFRCYNWNKDKYDNLFPVNLIGDVYHACILMIFPGVHRKFQFWLFNFHLICRCVFYSVAMRYYAVHQHAHKDLHHLMHQRVADLHPCSVLFH